MLDFQPTIVAFPIGSTLTTQTSKAQEVGKEMEIESRGADTNVGTGI
jgi:hypothetical protein